MSELRFPLSRTGGFFLPEYSFSGPKKELQKIEKLERDIEEANTLIGEKERDIAFLKKTCKKLGLM